MFRKRVFALVVVLAALAILAVAVAPLVYAAGGREDRVRKASEAWDEAFNAAAADPNDENLAKLMERYEDDAVSMAPGFPASVGKDASRADFVAFFTEFESYHETTIVDILLSGNLAVEQADYFQTFTPKDGSALFQEHGKHIVVYKKSGDSWKVVKEIWNSHPEP